MLNSIRNKTKGWVAYLIIGLIAVPFALFGISEYFTGTGNIVVANVDDESIYKDEFLSIFNSQKRRLQESLGDKYNAEFENITKRSIIHSIVNKHLLSQLAERLGHASTVSELQTLIRADNAFQVDGKFSLQRYKQLIRLNGYSEARYESLRLDELNEQQIQSNLLDSAFVTPSALKHIQTLYNQQRKFRYLQINTEDYLDTTKVADEKAQELYDEQQQSFFEPQQVKLEFVELSLKKIAEEIQVRDDELLDFYTDEKQRFSTEEERQAQHILLSSEEKANEIIAELKNGGDFAKLAAEHSKDDGSKEQGGDLGFFSYGVMVPEFEEKVFAMEEGELSDPVKSEFGYHIIKLNKIKPSVVKSFESVKAELQDLYKKFHAQKKLYDLSERLAYLAYEESLEEVTEKMGLTLQSTDFFNQNNKTLDKEIITAAFSDEILNKGENSSVLELAEDRFMVIRLQEKIAKQQKTFTEVQTEIKTHLATLSAKTLVDNIAQELIDLLTKNNPEAEDFVVKNKLKWQDIDWVDRNSNQADATIINKVFTLPKPKKSASIYAIQELSSGVVVIDLSAVKTTDETKIDAIEKLISSAESEQTFQSIIKTLRNNADVEIFFNRL